MKIESPSSVFDEAVAAVCQGLASDDQAKALNELLRNDPAALDEYIVRVELHSRLASEPDLFITVPQPGSVFIGGRPGNRQPNEVPGVLHAHGWNKAKVWTIALAACLALLTAGFWAARQLRSTERSLTTSKAVALLNRTVDVQWNPRNEIPRLGTPLEPGLLRLEGGLVEVIFYSGARLVFEGPAEVRLISQNAAFLQRGRFVAEVPDQARGFQIETSQATISVMGTSFGLETKDQAMQVHAFKGNIKLSGGGLPLGDILREGAAALIESGHAPRLMAARPAAFASLFDLEARSAVADARRHDQWRKACQRLETESVSVGASSISRTSRLPDGSFATWESRWLRCRMRLSWVANGRKVAGRKSGLWISRA